MEIDYSEKMFYNNKEIIKQSIYADFHEEETGFNKCISYYLYDISKFPIDKYIIKVIDIYFDKFDLHKVLENKYNYDIIKLCSIILKIYVFNKDNNKVYIKYIEIEDYNFFYEEIEDSSSYNLGVEHLYVQGIDIIDEIIKKGRIKIPEIIKQLDINYYNQYKKEYRWE